IAVLAGVAAVALGLDTGVLAELSQDRAGALEKKLLERFRPQAAIHHTVSPATGRRVSAAGGAPLLRAALFAGGERRLDLPVEGTLPPIAGAVEWLNSPPLTAES